MTADATSGIGVAGVESLLEEAARRLGDDLGVDGVALLHARRVLLGLRPRGTVSAGGSCRLVRAADGWFAINLARTEDRDAVPAWIGREWTGPVWGGLAEAASQRSALDAVERAQLLGIPAAVAVAPEDFHGTAVSLRSAGPRSPAGRRGARDERATVVDLSALWAGPLCARLLGGALAARVVKVEDVGRPDRARAGPPALWQALNGDKEERRVDLGSVAGRAELATVLAGARVVVSAARPRALAQLGLDPAQLAARGAVWVSITGYGLVGPRSGWAAFGDDAAVGGGAAVAAGGREPVFVGDAVGDPLGALGAAVAATGLLRDGRSGVVDASMAGIVNAALRGRAPVSPWPRA